MKKKVSKSMKSRSSRSSQRGGSPAADLVMQASNSPPVMNDFVTSPRIRDGPMSEPYGGQCGGQCGGQYGGSDASDMVMEKLANTSTTNKFPEGFNVTGNMESLNLYKPSGGSRKGGKSRKGRKSHKGGKTRKSKNTKSKNTKSKRRMMKGGGSDWMSSQYSLGSYNAAEASVAPFSQSVAASRNDYMNPPTLGLAGSGAPMGALEGANVRMVGSPLV